MCGITGIYAFNELGRMHLINLSNATDTLASRGPDFKGLYDHYHVGLGHQRLSIIDLSIEANQPMHDESGRYTVVFNGEIYNFKALKEELVNDGFSFRTSSDTEVLLKLYIRDGEKCLSKLNGFFAFAIYDQAEDVLFIARDRMGIKPLVYYHDGDKLLFASEMKALFEFGISKEIDFNTLFSYLQLNYIPNPATILKNTYKLQPGHYLKVSKGKIRKASYYEVPYDRDNPSLSSLSYDQQKKQLIELLDESVQKRLVADVPVGTFLSGGIDSSIISTLAKRHTNNLGTFSIGYHDEPFFDETHYAKMVAQHIGSDHTTFKLTNDDLYEHLNDVLTYIDEPYADSSALPLYLLTQKTRNRVKVALSGDGADELFSGYNKHHAAYLSYHGGLKTNIVSQLLPLWKALPKSRNGAISNKVRQLQRFAEGMRLSNKERYWQWATLSSAQQAAQLFTDTSLTALNLASFKNTKSNILKNIDDNSKSINDILYTDTHLVLVNDMLTKVDLMSMANSLEVRVPFLDHHIVEFAFQLPEESKINSSIKKRILQDAFKDLLPAKLYNRPKHGFEVPLLKWFRTELKSKITNDLLSEEFVKSQGIFDYNSIDAMIKKLFSKNPEDVHARIWGLIVFQSWWKKYMA